MNMDARENMFQKLVLFAFVSVTAYSSKVSSCVLYRQIMPSGNKECPQGSESILSND